MKAGRDTYFRNWWKTRSQSISWLENDDGDDDDVDDDDGDRELFVADACLWLDGGLPWLVVLGPPLEQDWRLWPSDGWPLTSCPNFRKFAISLFLRIGLEVADDEHSRSKIRMVLVT